MDLPKLTPGKRHALARPPGSADALLLAQLARREADQKRLTIIICADASDARRLQDELAFFAAGPLPRQKAAPSGGSTPCEAGERGGFASAPPLRTVLFPDWETLP
jgi:transcription-repair coupling factor (superfamily II helicase)